MRIPNWVRQNPKKAARLRHRIQDGLREIGVLLMAFAPLDAALVGWQQRWGFLAFFLGAGVFIFSLALLLEWRSQNAN